MRIRFMLSALLALAVTGCFQYEETLSLNEDGSGSIDMHYAIDSGLLEQMESMAAAFGEPVESEGDDLEDLENMFDREEIEAHLKKAGDDVTLTAYEQKETEDQMVWDLGFAFKNMQGLETMSKALEEEVNQGGSSSSGPPLPEFVKQDDGTWLFTRDLDLDEGMGDMQSMADMGESMQEDAWEEDESDSDMADDTATAEETEMDEAFAEFEEAMAAMGEAMAAMMEGMGSMRLAFTVNFPGEVIESNATEVDGNTARWIIEGSDMMSSEPMEELRAVIRP